MQKIRSQLRNSNICVEAENDRRITGLAGASPVPVGLFRSRLSLESAEDKKRHTESGFAGKRKVAGGLENYCKKIRTNEDNTGAMQLFGDKVDL